MATLTPVEGNPFAADSGGGFRFTPVQGNPFASEPAGEAGPGKPMVPLYVPDGRGGEVNVNANPGIRRQFDTMQAEQDAARAKERAAFDATRTPLTRVGDTATFIASLPVRTLTKGQYGIGDVFGLASKTAGTNALMAEQDFARANQTGLEYAAQAGDVLTGVPMLSTMGAVPGQVLRTGAAATRQFPGEVNRLLRDTTGSAKLPGKAPAGPLTAAEFHEQFGKADPTVYQRIPYLASKELRNELLFPEVRDGKVVGLAAIEQSPSQPGVYWSNFTAVDPAYRQQGIGKSLVQQKLDYAGAQGKQLKLSSMSGEGEAYLSKAYAGKPNVLREGDTDFAGKPLIRDGKLVGTTGDAQVDQALVGSAGNVSQALQQTLRLQTMAEQFGRPLPEAAALADKLKAVGGQVQAAGGKVGDYGSAPTAARASSGGSVPPGPPPAPPSAPPPAGGGGGGPTNPGVNPANPLAAPTRADTFAAADRVRAGVGANIDLPEMVVGNRYKQGLAAGLRSIPFAGEPVEMMFEKGLRQLGEARSAAAGQLGSASGKELSGAGIRQGSLEWIKKNSKDIATDLYGRVYGKIDPEAIAPLSSTRELLDEFIAEMDRSTGTAQKRALDMAQDAANRPGLTVKGLAELREEVGDALKESVIASSPSERALRRLYGSLTEDLRANVRKIGGGQALRDWEVANREMNVITGKRNRLSKIIGVNEAQISDEAIFNRARSLADAENGNLKSLRLLRDTVGPNRFGDFGAEVAQRMGRDPKTGLFSGDRYLTAYGKLSEEGKQLIFGAAKPHLDDIALISKKYGELSARFNRSNTGVVNSVLKILSNPAAVGVNSALALTNPVSAATAVGQVGGLVAGRRVAWALARPAAAQKAARVMRAFYGAEALVKGGVEAVAKREQTLATAVRAYAAQVAKDTGANAADLEKSVMEQIQAARQGRAGP